jgi:hypothetical protein
MKRWMHRVTLAALVTLAVGVPTAHAASSIVLPRAGQVGLGLQVQAGTLLKSGGLGEEFGSGPGLAVRLRYRMRFERAIGLSFDVQRLKSRDPSAREGAFDSLGSVPGTTQLLRDRLKMVTAGIEFYQLFDTRDRTVKMLSAGAGLAQVSARLNDGETQFPIAGDGVYLSLGAGIERFAYRSIAWDLSTRYMTIFHDKKVNHDIQLSLGFIFYAAY